MQDLAQFQLISHRYMISNCIMRFIIRQVLFIKYGQNDYIRKYEIGGTWNTRERGEMRKNW